MGKTFLRILGVLLVAVALSPATTIDFATTFGPEAPDATGSGTGFFKFNTTAQTLFIDVNWEGLSGVTTVAHIHCCVDPEGTVGVAVSPPSLPGFPVGVSEGTYTTTLDLTLESVFAAAFLTANGGTAAGASAALLQGMLDGRAYFNIHSSTFRGGEIRDFLQPVPEPGTFAMAGLMMVGLLAWRRRKAL